VGLDPNQIIKVRELIIELGRDHTVVLSTHILPDVEQVCERVAIIDRGRIVADGTPDQLRSRMVGNPRLLVELRGANGDGREALLALPGVTGSRGSEAVATGRALARQRPPRGGVPARGHARLGAEHDDGDPGLARGRLRAADHPRGAAGGGGGVR
jgi:ABC-type multidrug transport system ATPase subunit